MQTDKREKKRRPPRPTVDESVEVLLKGGASIYEIRIDRRNDVIFAQKKESDDVTLHEAGEWQKPHGTGL